MRFIRCSIIIVHTHFCVRNVYDLLEGFCSYCYSRFNQTDNSLRCYRNSVWIECRNWLKIATLVRTLCNVMCMLCLYLLCICVQNGFLNWYSLIKRSSFVQLHVQADLVQDNTSNNCHSSKSTKTVASSFWLKYTLVCEKNWQRNNNQEKLN